MRYQTVVLASAIALAVAGCSKSSPTGPGSQPTYNSVAGSYAGPMSGLNQGIAIVATLTVTITQNDGTLGGSYGLSGTLTDGVNVVDITGTGTLSGTIASGNNPSVNVTVRSGDCPAYSAQFSGAYDTANSRMTLTGPVQIYATDCSRVAITYPTTFILTH